MSETKPNPCRARLAWFKMKPNLRPRPHAFSMGRVVAVREDACISMGFVWSGDRIRVEAMGSDGTMKILNFFDIIQGSETPS